MTTCAACNHPIRDDQASHDVPQLGVVHTSQQGCADADVIARILRNPGPVDDDGRDWEPDSHSQAEIDRRGDEAADLDYDRRNR